MMINSIQTNIMQYNKRLDNIVELHVSIYNDLRSLDYLTQENIYSLLFSGLDLDIFILKSAKNKIMNIINDDMGSKVFNNDKHE